MQAKFERVDAGHDASFTARYTSGPGWPFTWHFHPEYELTLITRGSGQRYVGDGIAEFREEDLVLLGPNLPHTWYSRPPVRNPPHEAVVIQFLPSCFGERFFEAPELRHVGALLRRASQGLHFSGSAAGAAVARIAAMPQLSPLARLTELLTVLDLLARQRGARTLSSTHFAPSLRRDEQRRIERVLRYINESYTGEIRIAEAAAIAHLSESAFSRFFHRSSGKTFTRYLNELRVGRACELLAQTDRNITVIALDCGFNNLSNFNRKFRQLRGVPPREYRGRFQESPV